MATSNPRAGDGTRRSGRIFGILTLVVILVAAGYFLIFQRGTESAVAQAVADADADSTAISGVSDEADSTGTADASANEDEADPIPVEVAAVDRRDVPTYFSGSATLEAENEARLLAQTSGQIVRLHVEEGDRVAKGQVLLELDGREQTIQLEERRADVENLRQEMNRQSTLLERELSSRSEFVAAKSAYEAAAARLRAAELTESLTRVVAPFDGLVSRRLVGVGDHTATGTELFVLADPEPLLARIYMPESQVNRVAVGQPVSIECDSESETFPGRVVRIAPVVDRRTGTVKVTCELTDRVGDRVRPGSFVKVRIETDRHPNAITVPERAIVERGGETFVYRVTDDRVRRVRVETGTVYDDRIEVLSGLEAEAIVVVAGQSSLESDSRIRVIETPSRDDT